MAQRHNEFGLPIGDPVPDWTARKAPSRGPMEGRYCRIEALDVDRHAADLFKAFGADARGEMWTYMGSGGPFATLEQLTDWMQAISRPDDPLFHAIIDRATGKAVGTAAYLRIEPQVGVIEVGHIAYSPRLQRTPIATDAMFTMMRRVFNELGYRRYEWKCDALNVRSRRAAARYGFSYDGLFEQATIYKGRNRDTAWFSMLDRDWPKTEQAYEAWLDPANFDIDGQQKSRLSDLIAEARQ